MKRNRIIGGLLAVLVVCVFGLFALGSGEEGSTYDQGTGTADTAESNNQEETAKVAEGKGNLGNYDIEIKSCRLAKDYEGKDAVIIKYGFTNNSEDAKSFMVAINETVFQNGVQLETAVVTGSDKNYKADNVMKEIKSGATLDVEKAYKLDDTISDIEVEVEEFASLNKNMVKKTFSIIQ